MRRMLALGVGLAAISGLAACQKETRAANTAEPPRAAAGAPTAPVGPPKRKPGLWTQTISTAGVSQTSKVCLDAETDARMSAWGQAMDKDMCAKNSVTPVAGGWRLESECDMGEAGKASTSGTATGDFNSKYVVKAITVTTGSSMPQANGTHAMALTATWEGACPAAMQPGDVRLANGMTFNLQAMAAKK